MIETYKMKECNSDCMKTVIEYTKRSKIKVKIKYLNNYIIVKHFVKY